MEIDFSCADGIVEFRLISKHIRVIMDKEQKIQTTNDNKNFGS